MLNCVKTNVLKARSKTMECWLELSRRVRSKGDLWGKLAKVGAEYSDSGDGEGPVGAVSL